MSEKQRLLREYLTEYSLLLSEEQIFLLNNFLLMVEDKNRRFNLTSITEWPEIVIKHVLDSLSIIKTNWWKHGQTVLDIGSGAGFPGVPLALLSPQREFFLLEANRKKATFLQEAIKELQLTNIRVLSDRAEVLAHNPGYRDFFDLVTARAVASLPALLELTLPFCRVQGIFVAYKGPKADGELRESFEAQRILGGEYLETYSYNLIREMGTRNLVFFRKTAPTSDKYPRRPGIPVKRPL